MENAAALISIALGLMTAFLCIFGAASLIAIFKGYTELRGLFHSLLLPFASFRIHQRAFEALAGPLFFRSCERLAVRVG